MSLEKTSLIVGWFGEGLKGPYSNNPLGHESSESSGYKKENLSHYIVLGTSGVASAAS